MQNPSVKLFFSVFYLSASRPGTPLAWITDSREQVFQRSKPNPKGANGQGKGVERRRVASIGREGLMSADTPAPLAPSSAVFVR